MSIFGNNSGGTNEVSPNTFKTSAAGTGKPKTTVSSKGRTIKENLQGITPLYSSPQERASEYKRVDSALKKEIDNLDKILAVKLKELEDKVFGGKWQGDPALATKAEKNYFKLKEVQRNFQFFNTLHEGKNMDTKLVESGLNANAKRVKKYSKQIL